MCVSCGCGKVNDDHGDERNITMDSLQEAAEAAGKPLGEVATNIAAACAANEDETGTGTAAQERASQLT